MDRSEFEVLHPAVKWAYRPGSQMVSMGLIPIPWRFEENFFYKVLIYDDFLVVNEQPYSNHAVRGWLKPTYAISPLDGTRLIGRRLPDVATGPGPGNQLKLDPKTGLLACWLRDGRWLVCTEGRPRITKLFISEPAPSPKIGTLIAEWKVPLDLWTVEDIDWSADVTILGFQSFIICIDNSKLPPLATTQAGPD